MRFSYDTVNRRVVPVVVLGCEPENADCATVCILAGFAREFVL